MQQRQAYLARLTFSFRSLPPNLPAAFDGVFPSPLIDALHAGRTSFTMERSTNIPRTRTSSVSTTSHSHGQNHERKKTTTRRGEGCATTTSAGRGTSSVDAGLVLLSAVLALSSLIAPAAARTIAYCSSVNTGSDYNSSLFSSWGCGFDGVYILMLRLEISQFQSHGLCYDNCNGDGYAFAIVQGTYCWCSNYVPGADVSVSECSDPCPGYPDDACGNTRENLYGYITLPRKPSGTKGAETTVSTTSTSPKTTTIQVGPITTLIIVWLLPSGIC